jgi:hypothetical protein
MPQLIFISEMLMEPKELPLVFWDAALPFIEIIRDEMFEQLRDGLAGRLIGVDLFPFEGDLRRVVADQDVVTGEH